MRQLKGDDGAPILGKFANAVELSYVAAALGVLCDRFNRLTGQPNYSAAATAFGKAQQLAEVASTKIKKWMAKLRQLDAALRHADEVAIASGAPPARPPHRHRSLTSSVATASAAFALPAAVSCCAS